MNKIIFLLLIGATVFTSCGKDHTEPNPTPTPTDKTDKTAPSKPSGLAAGTVTANSVNFSWTASTDEGTNGGTPSGVTGYKIYVATVEKPLTVSGTTVTDNTVAASTTYSYTVAAVDGAGNISAQSDPLVITTPSAPTAPGVSPTVINSSSITTTNMEVSATVTGSNLGAVRVIREWTDEMTNTTQRDSVLKGTASGTISHTFTSNTPGREYKVWFSATSSIGYTAGASSTGTQKGCHINQIIIDAIDPTLKWVVFETTNGNMSGYVWPNKSLTAGMGTNGVGIAWGCNGTFIGTTGTSFSVAAPQTTTISNVCTNSAAKMCQDNGRIFETLEMYQKINLIKNHPVIAASIGQVFGDGMFWVNTETTASTATSFALSTGTAFSNSAKVGGGHVRGAKLLNF